MIGSSYHYGLSPNVTNMIDSLYDDGILDGHGLSQKAQTAHRKNKDNSSADVHSFDQRVNLVHSNKL